MAKPLSSGHVSLGFEFGKQTSPEVPPETPWRVALLGDFGGKSRRAARLGDRKPLLIDRDNFDEVLAGLGVAIELSLVEGGPRSTIRISEMEDFHPDRLFERVEVFEALRGLRRRLSNSATFRAAAEEMRGWAATSEPERPVEPPPPPPAPPAEGSRWDSGGLLEEILSRTPEQPVAAKSDTPAGWGAFLRRIVEPHLAAEIDYTKQAQLIAAVDEVTGRQMRAILHHPAFQAVEAAWRGAYFLVRRLETDERLKLYLLDVTKDELAADLASSDDSGATGAHRLFVEQTVGTPGGQPWAILAGQYTFSQSKADVDLLRRMAGVAGMAGAPFVAGASPALLGRESMAGTPDPDDFQPMDTDSAARWDALRRLPEAASLGLALPRVLLRLPYGKGMSSMEQFDFEEAPAGLQHEEYLWGNPSFFVAYLLSEAFSRHGWRLRGSIPRQIDELPLHVIRDGGDTRVQPCAEGWLSDRAAEAIAERGLIVFQSVQNQAAVTLYNLPSLANPPSALAGRWR